MPPITSLLHIRPETADGREALSRMKPADFDLLRKTLGYRAYHAALSPVVLTAFLAAWGLLQFVLVFTFPETAPRNVWSGGGAVLAMAALLGLFVVVALEAPVKGLKPLHETPARVAALLPHVEAYPRAREYRDKVIAEGGRELLEFDARALDIIVKEALAEKARDEQALNWHLLHSRTSKRPADTPDPD